MFRRRKKVSTGSASLNLTTMIDLLTVILIFLIKNYSLDPSYLTPTQDIALAKTSSEQAAKNKPVVILGKDGILFDGKAVTLDILAKTLESAPKEAVILQADRGVNYDQVRPVLRILGLTGFQSIQFAGLYSGN